MFVFTWPTRGHNDDDDEEEKCKERQAGGEVAASVIQAELSGVPQEDPLLLLPGGQLELGVGHLVLGVVGVVHLVVPGPRLLGQRSVDHQRGLLQVMDSTVGFAIHKTKTMTTLDFGKYILLFFINLISQVSLPSRHKTATITTHHCVLRPL